MRRLVLAFLLSTLVAACGGDSAGPPPAREPTPLDHATTGTITGEVRFEGTPPASQPIGFGGFAECAAQHPAGATAGDVLVRDGAVQNAFVWVKDGLGDRVFAVPTEPVVVDQVGCLYAPRVVGVQVGQLVKFVNGDPLLHNVHGTPKHSSAWNVSLGRKGAEREIRIAKPEVMVSVRCDLHPWMQGWIGALDHPYFAVTGPDGRFALRDVPPGTYTVAAWHERFGTREARVTLEPKGAATASFTFGVDAKAH
jgi:plastocyanin